METFVQIDRGSRNKSVPQPRVPSYCHVDIKRNEDQIISIFQLLVWRWPSKHEVSNRVNSSALFEYKCEKLEVMPVKISVKRAYCTRRVHAESERRGLKSFSASKLSISPNLSPLANRPFSFQNWKIPPGISGMKMGAHRNRVHDFDVKNGCRRRGIESKSFEIVPQSPFEVIYHVK